MPSQAYPFQLFRETRMRARSLRRFSGSEVCRYGLMGALMWPSLLAAHDPEPVDIIEVTESRENNLVGVADSATEGTVGAKQLEARPILRPGELLEAAPGIVITQHSGDGKANQYFLRGFNLDHGTDLALSVAGTPVNMPTHGHGQGYADFNFVIPELVSGMQYKKGPYFADVGDFGAAGAVDVQYVNTLSQGLAELSAGDFNFRRLLVAGSPHLGAGHLLYAVEASYTDGPWENPEQYQKWNGVLRYSQGSPDSGFRVTVMGYSGTWDSTDQVPLRAIEDGSLSRFGAIDPTDGGQTSRASLDAEWMHKDDNTSSRVNGYLMGYQLNLWSNFTYFLDDPENGDQFEQADQRIVGGFSARHTRIGLWGKRPVENAIGLQTRVDDIQTVGLYHTQARVRLSTTREDSVLQASGALWAQNAIRWMPGFRTLVGLRADLYRFDVRAGLAENGGQRVAGLLSPKLGMVFGPWANTEVYLNAGQGFHSNDARGTTITVDPASGEPVSGVTPLVPARGAELGLRSVALPHLQATVSLWGLDIDSELLFVGDAGTTEASRPSRRLGVELANFYAPRPWCMFDVDLAFSQARFTDLDPAGAYIPGAIEGVVSVGANLMALKGFSTGLRLRYFGPRPLLEDNSVRSQASTLLYAQLGYAVGEQWRIALEAYNLLDSSVSDQDYYYTSRLPGEASEGIDDIHTHPAEPRSFRLSFAGRF